MTIRDVIRQEAESAINTDPLTVAAAVLAKVTKADLLDLLAEEVKAVQRAAARSTERRAFRDVFIKTVDRPRAQVSDGLRSLFATPFHLGNGEEVNWLTASVEQHRQRIEHLSKIRAGLDRTIAQHEEAITLIEQAGASCLADITEVRAQAA